MRILLIDDNTKTPQYIAQGLKENFFIAEIAIDG